VQNQDGRSILIPGSGSAYWLARLDRDRKDKPTSRETGLAPCYPRPMGNPNQSCSVCALPADTLDAINSKIRAKAKFRALAAETGLSKSTLQRHASRCLPRETIAAHKSNAFNPATGRVFVLWPGEEFQAQDQFRAGDILLQVSFEQTRVAHYGNPRAAPYSDETFGEFLALAKLEDDKRAKAKLPAETPAEPV
jgi:hypothetical protein